MRFNEMDPNRKKAMDAALEKVKTGLPKQQPMPNSEPAPMEKDPHADKSRIWKKGFADGKAGRMDRRASDAYGPRVGEYEAGYAAGSKVEEAMTTTRQKLVKDFEKVAGYKIADKEAWYQAVNDYYKGKRDSWPDPREFGLKEGGFFDPDQPNPGDMVKHRNGAVGKVKTITTQNDETWVNFKSKDGEMHFGQWKKHVFPMDTDDKVGEASRPTKMRLPDERFSKELNTQDFELSSMYDHRSIDQLYQSLNVANNAIQKATLKIEKLQDAGKKPVKTQQALEVLIRKRDYISDLIDQKEMQSEGLEEALTEAQFDEAAGEKDACYHKVKSRYKVWPSAYASGALVKCRKVGAKNWGNKSKKE
jgi:hypothetical protein